jgi:hypothetical protein
MLGLVNLFQFAKCAIREDLEALGRALLQHPQKRLVNQLGIVREKRLRDFAGHVCLRPTSTAG